MGIVSDEQIVAIRTHTGVPVYQFRGDRIVQMEWTREQREVSTCDLVLPPVTGVDDLPTPWLHWVDVWNGDGDERYWSGPIVDVTLDHRAMTVAASDAATWAGGTRCPITKRWEAADPAQIAGELWDGMIEVQGLQTRPVVRFDPRGGRFDFASSNKDGQVEMLDQTIRRLVEVGQLHWTVVAGRPILGPAPFDSVAELGEHHFVGENAFRLHRSGGQMFNDVMVRGADAVVTKRVEAGGLNRQTIKDIESMFGVSNLDRAAHQLVRYTGAVRDSITMPNGAVLAPDAPVTIGELIPSARFVVEAFGLLAVMELDQVSVTYSQGVSQVAVKLEAVNDDLPELLSAGLGVDQ
ncbi:Uncharacterised protein [Mycolicibacterium vanbaalenii]|uniref:Minor tail protein n=1 Tax=Mycolicibacterium vanbaalenii TaxID=110539 RepID=A0A5S9MP69_MYCVN|nr:hypothetical protein [Mycolicibacterium vanbaalenii]CAA0078269.1 Uncharacterised protein [Mycolicibacterium vanbaalenii]